MSVPASQALRGHAVFGALLVLASADTAATQMLVGDGSISCGALYTVAAGDTLSRISARAYGDTMLYGFIADANWDVLGGNPENIAIGTSLAIPCIDVDGNQIPPDQAGELSRSMQNVVAAEGALSGDQLDTLFGPVALFPDQVLTPVLVATTFPLDVVKAARFLEESSSLLDQDRVAEAAGKPWDESVRELAAGFPDLLARMSDNIDWTEQAGEAVVAQTDDVLASVQRLRGKAIENGYLVDNEAQKVVEEDNAIIIASASPGVVYVPTYDSQVVYTTPVSGPPIYHYGTDPYYHEDWNDDWGDALIAGGILLGGAILIDEIFDDDDWDGWDGNDEIDWDRGDITIDRGDINIDRDEINIDRDRVEIGDGDRAGIATGDRVSISDSDRPQVDRSELLERGAALGAAGAAIASQRKSLATPASREAARQKIQQRKATNAPPAKLNTARPNAQRQPAARNIQSAVPSRVDRVSRPQTARQPAVRSPSRSNTFQRPAGASRPSVSSQRGRASYGGARSGGGLARRR